MRKSLAMFLVGLSASPTARPQAAPVDFQATVSGRPLELHDFTGGAFGVFEAGDPLDVTIGTTFDVRWVDIRPRSAGIAASIGPDHHTVRFMLRGAVPLTVEFNGDHTRVVHLFGYLPEKDAPAKGSPNVRYFGPGMHEAGLIELKDNETLYLAPGAWVRGNVRSVGTRNVAILGRGVLDGSDVPMRAGTSAEEKGGEGLRNMIYLHDTTDVRVGGITIFNSQDWTVYLNHADHTRVDGVRILNPSARYGDDGFDLVSSSDVLVENIFVRTNDDCVVVKNLRDVDTHGVTVRHAVLWNMPSGGNGLEIGFEMRRQPTHDIHFEDIDLIHVERGSAISIHNGDAATVEDVSYDDIRVEDARRKLFDFAVVYAQYGADRPATDAENSRRLDRGGTWDGLLRYSADEKAERSGYRGHIRNIRVNNLRVVEGSLPYSIVAGFDAGHGVDDVRFSGLSYLSRPLVNAADARCVVENAEGVEFK
jgi:hypothetical protein